MRYLTVTELQEASEALALVRFCPKIKEDIAVQILRNYKRIGKVLETIQEEQKAIQEKYLEMAKAAAPEGTPLEQIKLRGALLLEMNKEMQVINSETYPVDLYLIKRSKLPEDLTEMGTKIISGDKGNNTEVPFYEGFIMLFDIIIFADDEYEKALKQSEVTNGKARLKKVDVSADA